MCTSSIPIPLYTWSEWLARKSQAQVSSALNLQSSATLGTGMATTHQHRLDQLEDKEVRRALDGHSGQGKRRRNTNQTLAGGASDEDDDDTNDFQMDLDAPKSKEDEDEDMQEGMSRSRPVVIVDSGFSTTIQSPEPEHSPLPPTVPEIGGALKRNADGSVAAPRISRRKPKSAKVSPVI